MEGSAAVYILASGFRGTLYVGMASDLPRRVREHRRDSRPGFTGRHEVRRLVHYEMYPDIELARARELQLKRWHRQWKINLIEEKNPHWEDLAIQLGLRALPGNPPSQ